MTDISRISKRTKSFLRRFGVGAVCILVAALLIGTSDSFNTCVRHRKNDPNYQIRQKNGTSLLNAFTSLSLYYACSRGTLDENDGPITALATVVLAVFTFALWQSTHRLWIAGERQAEFNKITADAAIWAQRARIQIDPTWETNAPPADYAFGVIAFRQEFKFGTRMVNVGQMPANNIENWIGYCITEKEIPENFEFPENSEPTSRTGVLGTKQILLGPHIPPERYISASEVAEMHAERRWLYFYGWVTYSDGIGSTPRRTTKFCYRVRVTGNPRCPVVFIPHGRRNYSD